MTVVHSRITILANPQSTASHELEEVVVHQFIGNKRTHGLSCEPS